MSITPDGGMRKRALSARQVGVCRAPLRYVYYYDADARHVQRAADVTMAVCCRADVPYARHCATLAIEAR